MEFLFYFFIKSTFFFLLRCEMRQPRDHKKPLNRPETAIPNGQKICSILLNPSGCFTPQTVTNTISANDSHSCVPSPTIESGTACRLCRFLSTRPRTCVDQDRISVATSTVRPSRADNAAASATTRALIPSFRVTGSAPVPSTPSMKLFHSI